MNFKKTLGLLICVVLAVSCFAQGDRGKAELKAGAGSITVDYGRPALKGREMRASVADPGGWLGHRSLASAQTRCYDLGTQEAGRI